MKSSGPKQPVQSNTLAPDWTTASDAGTDDTTCPRCGESHDLAKVKGCITCLKCGFKFDCNGW